MLRDDASVRREFRHFDHQFLPPTQPALISERQSLTSTRQAGFAWDRGLTDCHRPWRFVILDEREGFAPQQISSRPSLPTSSPWRFRSFFALRTFAVFSSVVSLLSLPFIMSGVVWSRPHPNPCLCSSTLNTCSFLVRKSHVQMPRRMFGCGLSAR